MSRRRGAGIVPAIGWSLPVFVLATGLSAARADEISDLRANQELLQRASIIGRIFWAGAIDALSPELEGIEAALDDLLLRDFVVRESRSSITGESAFRFKHVLIREVAYGGLSKSARAQYHARFAKWLFDRAGEELLEIRAFHLDQAARLVTELDGAPPPELAHDAAKVLTKAGRRALNREAFKTARKLLLRAGELDPSLDRRYLAARAAWRIGDMPVVAVEMEDMWRAAARHLAPDREAEVTALLVAVEQRSWDRIAIDQPTCIPGHRGTFSVHRCPHGSSEAIREAAASPSRGQRRRLSTILSREFDVIHYHNVSLIGGPGVLALGTLLLVASFLLMTVAEILRRRAARRTQNEGGLYA